VVEKLPPAKSSFRTGWRTDQSHRGWIARPRNRSSLPSNSSFRVSTRRLFPKRLGRDRKYVDPLSMSRSM